MATDEHDKDGNVLYLTDENGKYIKDSNGELQPLYYYLKPEEEQHLKKALMVWFIFSSMVF
ncbi:hypothetical protein NPX99_03910 [Bartonella sp. 220]|uniref:hypothetical protein n=1 Tax=Bartonella sp. 220B TaxID=2967260 RepID=UPI0022A9DF95|nr:hypothetical protein [Bartonella sp. 220B]MCZ2158425.1 hypothetical protein [Bartonella sp. 220B]